MMLIELRFFGSVLSQQSDESFCHSGRNFLMPPFRDVSFHRGSPAPPETPNTGLGCPDAIPGVIENPGLLVVYVFDRV